VADSTTIRDVARLAAVSVSTVSNVLNGRSRRMRPATRRRVERAIARLSYRPNRAARALRTGHARTIALVVPSVANPFWGAFAVHVESAARAHGYQVVLCNTDRDRAREHAYVAGLWRDGIRDVILGSSLPSLDHIADLMARGLSVVALGMPAGADGIAPAASISVDNYHGSVLATQHLLRQGHRRIAFLSDLARFTSRLERYRGYRDALRRAGLSVDPALVWRRGAETMSRDAEGADVGQAGARHFLARPNPPTAIVTANDLCALGVLAAARDLGLAVPRDLSVVGFDDIALARLVNPPLTTVRQPAPDLARVAVEQVMRATARRTDDRAGRDTVTLIVRPRLMVRESTAPPRRSRVGR
jgi:DNA-binding LacI/PurR family transcriptional regulator